MKKLLTMFLVALLILSVACTKKAEEPAQTASQPSVEAAQPTEEPKAAEEPEATEFEEPVVTSIYQLVEIPLEQSPVKTLGEAYAVPSETYQTCTTDDAYIFVFEMDGVFYRVEADMTPELRKQLDAIDFFDEQKDEKVLALIGDLPLRRVVDLSATLPSQTELDELKGKTGEELIEMGYELGSGYAFEDKAELYLVRDLYEFHVYFNEKVPKTEDYDAAMDEILKSITVDRAEFFGLSQMASDPNLVY